MAWTLAPAIRSCLDSANKLAPGRSRKSDGTIGDAAHASRASDHNPDADRMVCAVDLTHDPNGGWDCVLRSQQATTDPRVKYVIWNRRIWQPGAGWQSYGGRNPHDHHMHISVTQAGKRDGRPWFHAVVPKPGTDAPVQVDRSGADPNDGRWTELATKAEIKEALREVLDADRLSWGPDQDPDKLRDADADDVHGETRAGVRRLLRHFGLPV